MAMGMYKDIEKNAVQSILNTLYERQYIEGYLQPFYKNFFNEHKETIRICHEIESLNVKEPEYHIGDLEIAYGALLRLFEIKEHFSTLAEFEEASMTYRRSTK